MARNPAQKAVIAHGTRMQEISTKREANMDDLRNRVTRHRRRGEGGFTLIELLVVIAILSVLAAIVIINVTGVKSGAQTASCKSDTQAVQTAVDGYYVQNGVYPVTGTDTATPGVNASVNLVELTGGTNPYLQTTPPTTESFTYTNATGTIQGSVQLQGGAGPTTC
jgi:prepilin-type N-terminal cleavage/methylation domain-containing protein